MLHCVCLDCGAKFKSETDSKQCRLCAVLDAEMFANVPPSDGDYTWPRSRRPSRDIVPPAAPLPAVIVPEEAPRVNFGSGLCSVDRTHGGPFVSRIKRPLLCHECARNADRIELGDRRSA